MTRDNRKCMPLVLAATLAVSGLAYGQQRGPTSPFGPPPASRTGPGYDPFLNPITRLAPVYTTTPYGIGGTGPLISTTSPGSFGPFISTASPSSFSPFVTMPGVFSTTPGGFATPGASGAGAPGTAGRTVAGSSFGGMQPTGVFGLFGGPAGMNPFSIFGTPSVLNPFSLYFGSNFTAPTATGSAITPTLLTPGAATPTTPTRTPMSTSNRRTSNRR